MKTTLLALFTALTIAGCSSNPTETNNIPPETGYKDINVQILTTHHPDTAKFIAKYITYTLNDTSISFSTPNGIKKYSNFDSTVINFKVSRLKETDTLKIYMQKKDTTEVNWNMISVEYYKNVNVVDFKKLDSTHYIYHNFRDRIKLLTIK
jgi:hypothetical protein